MQYVVKQHYAEATQEHLEKTLTAMDLAGMIDIPNGTTKNLPFLKMRATSDYTKYTAPTIQDRNTGNDTIVINTTPMVTFQIDVIDEEDNYIDIKPEVISDASYQIKKRIDGDFFSQVTNAKWKYDANGFGRNAGTLSPITLVTGASQNISTVFGKAKAGLTHTGANASKLALCVDDFIAVDMATLGLSVNGTTVADGSYERGFAGKFGGMKTYGVSTLYSTVTFDCATNPTTTDYVDIQGVRFTFKTTPANAGDIYIGASADATMANLILAINGTGTPGATTYTALDDDDRARLEGVVATDGTDLITIASKNGALIAQSSMTAAANDFGIQTTNCVIMEKGAIKMALRNSVKVDIRPTSDKLCDNYFIWARYGLKVTTRSKECMVVIPVVSQAAEA